MKAEGAGKAAMFADIRSGTTKLKKLQLQRSGVEPQLGGLFEALFDTDAIDTPCRKVRIPAFALP